MNIFVCLSGVPAFEVAYCQGHSQSLTTLPYHFIHTDFYRVSLLELPDELLLPGGGIPAIKEE